MPENMRHGRFWLKYDPKARLGWTKRPLGKTFFAKMPSVVATKLQLAEPKKYTGHSLRATAATILADEGCSLLTLKRHCDWDSDQVAEGYVRQSKKLKSDVSDTILGNPTPSSRPVAGTGGFQFYGCNIAKVVIQGPQ